jgi:hypothetical protein
MTCPGMYNGRSGKNRQSRSAQGERPLTIGPSRIHHKRR